MTGRTCVEAQGILEKNGFSYECVDQPGPDQRVTRTDPPSGSFEPLRTKVRIYLDVEVPVLKGEKVAMALRLLNDVGLLMDQASATPGSGEPGTVSSQTPEAHTRVLAGATVKVQVAPDQLLVEVDVEPYKVSLTTDPPEPKPGDRVILRAELEPRSSSSPEYRFSFEGEQGTGSPRRTLLIFTMRLLGSL